jgi:hypothetical protein
MYLHGDEACGVKAFHPGFQIGLKSQMQFIVLRWPTKQKTTFLCWRVQQSDIILDGADILYMKGVDIGKDR